MATVRGKIYLDKGGSMDFELYPDIAPNTVKNFTWLASQGFYDGLIFHRVIPGFMIQGGDPTGTGMGGPGWSIRGEFTNERGEVLLKHERGVLSMARAYDPHSAGSQFFIMHQAAPHLDGQYAAFGKLCTGFEHLDKIANTATDRADRPLEEQKIKHITITEPGFRPEEPEKV